MTPREYLEVARDRWRFIVAGLLMGLLVAGAVTLLTPRQYAAEVTVVVSAETVSDDPTVAYEGDQLAVQRMQTYVELMKSRRLATDVVNELGLNTTPDELASRITAASAPDTVLLTATITDGSADRAVQIANVVGARFIQNVAELEQPSDPARRPLIAAKVFEEAAPPVEVVAPRPALYLALGAVLGLLAGLGAALLRNSFDTSVKRRHELEAILDAPVLGEIGHDPKIAKSPLVVRRDPRAPVAESFRQLRTNVHFVDVERAHKVIVVTSSTLAEGKTTSVCNLGLAMAEGGLKVLIIDADLRRPGVSACLGIDGTIGVTDVLEKRLQARQAIQPAGPALDVLPSGRTPANPSELLGSEQTVALIAEARVSYDVVLIDTSPLLPVTDAAVLAPLVDGVILIVREGKTSVQDVQAAREALDAVSARLLGSVMTMVSTRGSNRYTRDNGFNGRVRRHDEESAVGTQPRSVPNEPADSARSPRPRSVMPSEADGQVLEWESGPPSR